MKRIKFEAIIKISDDLIIEDSMVNRTAGLLGEIESYDVKTNLDNETYQKENTNATDNSSDPFSQISSTINNANKIFYGSLSLEERKAVSLTIFLQANFEKINSDPEFKKKILDIFEKKFLLDQTLSQKLIDSSGENSSFDNFKNKFLDGDLTQILIYIWEKILSIGEEDDFEIELIENAANKFGLESSAINDTKKQGNDRAKIARAIDTIESGKSAYNKLKAFEKQFYLD